MLSHAVQNVLAKAVLEMRSRQHEFLTSEHILFALTYDREAKVILEGCGVDLEKLRLALEQFFKEKLEQVDPGMYEDEEAVEVMQTVAVERILARAYHHIISTQKEDIEVGDVLVSLFAEQDNWAVSMLNAQGLSRLDIVEFISHRMPKAGLEHGENQKGRKSESGALGHFCINLTERARKNELDPLIGREVELLRLTEILARRRKNNPILAGEAGIGKTSIVEGLASRIVQGKVPTAFLKTEIYSLDVSTLMAGAKYKGEFEARFKSVLAEIQEKEDAILVVDEIHSLLHSSQNSSGGLDAGSMLKPFLSTGTIRCIATTTYEDYRTTISKDRGLSRRFQKIDISEPTIEDSIEILKGLQEKYEEHHGVKYAKGVISAIVDLSARYIQDRMLPDKAIEVLDESASALRMKRSFKPNSSVRLHDIERVIARMANIPTASVSADEKVLLKDLESKLKARIFGQDLAISKVNSAILRSRANLSISIRPTGSFLFYGPTGVGKTELAKSLAEELGINFIRFDMSEYMEKHAVARLIGAPPGYVGFEQGGLLTEAVRKTPHAVILFDEIEKAHPDIYNILLQVMDYATLTDNNGKKADFRNTVIIMTTNAGAREMSSSTVGFATGKSDSVNKSKKAVENTFSPEFRNRLDALIPFEELSFDHIVDIVDKTVKKLFKGLTEKKIKLKLSKEAKAWLAKNGFNPKLGARPLEHLIRTELEDYLAQEVLFGSLTKGGTVEVTALSPEAEHLTLTAK